MNIDESKLPDYEKIDGIYWYYTQCQVCGKPLKSKSRRKLCQEHLKARRKQSWRNYQIRQTYNLPDGRSFRLTVKQREIAETLAMHEVEETATICKVSIDRIKKLMEGGEEPADFKDLVGYLIQKRADEYVPQLLKIYFQGLEQVKDTVSKKDKLDWIRTGLDHFDKKQDDKPKENNEFSPEDMIKMISLLGEKDKDDGNSESK